MVYKPASCATFSNHFLIIWRETANSYKLFCWCFTFLYSCTSVAKYYIGLTVLQLRTGPETNRAVHTHDPATDNTTKFSAKNSCPTRSAPSGLLSALSYDKHIMQWAVPVVSTNFLQYKIWFLELVAITIRGAASFMDRILATYMVTQATEGANSTYAGSDSDDSNQNALALSTSFNKLLSNTISWIQCVLVNLGVFKKTDLKVWDENRLTYCPSTRSWPMVKNHQSKFEDELKVGYLNRKNCFRTTMINLFEQVFGDMKGLGPGFQELKARLQPCTDQNWYPTLSSRQYCPIRNVMVRMPRQCLTGCKELLTNAAHMVSREFPHQLSERRYLLRAHINDWKEGKNVVFSKE